MSNQITLAEARNYLVKGCAPQIYREGEEYPIDHEGPVNQRRWQVVDALKHNFRSQRHPGFSRLALVKPELKGDTLILRAEGMGECAVPCDEAGEQHLCAGECHSRIRGPFSPHHGFGGDH